MLVTILAVLLAPHAGAFHEACPATTATFTLRVGEGGFYLLGAAAFEETNGHSGLQQGDLPDGCVADTQIL